MVRTGEPLFVSTRRERNELFPELAEQARSGGAMVVLPLAVEGRVFGAMSLSFEEEVEFGLERREMKIALARLASQNLARSQLYAEEQALRERMTFLAEASEMLSSSLDYHHTLGKLARLAVPGLADWCTIDMVGENGEIERLAVAHEDPEKVRWASELQERYPPNPDDPPACRRSFARVSRSSSRRSPQELLDEAIGDDQELRRIIDELGLRSSISVPLTARGRTFGALTLIAAESASALHGGGLRARDRARAQGGGGGRQRASLQRGGERGQRCAGAGATSPTGSSCSTQTA